jgi:hypothetical protein
VEKCVTHATRAERSFLIEEVCNFNDRWVSVSVDISQNLYLVSLQCYSNKRLGHLPQWLVQFQLCWCWISEALCSILSAIRSRYSLKCMLTFCV